MYKKMSVLIVTIALLGVMQHAECKKMFEQTRARVQEKYGAWKAGRQQKKATKQKVKELERAAVKEPHRGGFFGRFRKKEEVRLPRSSEEISKMKQEAYATIEQERPHIAQLKKQLAQEQEKPASQLSPAKQRKLEEAIQARESKRDKALEALSEAQRAGE